MQTMRDEFAEIDDEIIALTEQLEELSVRTPNTQPFKPRSSVSDHEAAIALFQDEVTARIQEVNDMVLTRSKALAAQDASDKRSVLRSAAASIYKLFGQEEAEATTAASKPATLQKPLNYQCCVCLDHFSYWTLIRLRCSDLWCHGCLKSTFLKAAKDTSMYPPKCCRAAIPVRLVKPYLSAKQRRDCDLAELEYSTPNKVYCAGAGCRRFIAPDQIRADRAQCDACGAVTCTVCRGRGHAGDCPDDPEVKATLALAKKKGWKRCYSCGSVVELAGGCEHMTCRCGTQFCYRCGGKYRACDCTK